MSGRLNARALSGSGVLGGGQLLLKGVGDPGGASRDQRRVGTGTGYTGRSLSPVANKESSLAKTVAGQLARIHWRAQMSPMTSAFSGISDLAGRATGSTRSRMTHLRPPAVTSSNRPLPGLAYLRRSHGPTAKC